MFHLIAPLKCCLQKGEKEKKSDIFHELTLDQEWCPVPAAGSECQGAMAGSLPCTAQILHQPDVDGAMPQLPRLCHGHCKPSLPYPGNCLAEGPRSFYILLRRLKCQLDHFISFWFCFFLPTNYTKWYFLCISFPYSFLQPGCLFHYGSIWGEILPSALLGFPPLS